VIYADFAFLGWHVFVLDFFILSSLASLQPVERLVRYAPCLSGSICILSALVRWIFEAERCASRDSARASTASITSSASSSDSMQCTARRQFAGRDHSSMPSSFRRCLSGASAHSSKPPHRERAWMIVPVCFLAKWAANLFTCSHRLRLDTAIGLLPLRMMPRPPPGAFPFGHRPVYGVPRRRELGLQVRGVTAICSSMTAGAVPM